MLQLASSLSYGALVVDFGGSYGGSNAAQVPSSFATGDYDFNGVSGDRAKILGWNSPFRVNNYAPPAGKTSSLSYGAQVANLGSSDDPAFGFVRLGGTGVIQFGNSGSAPGAQSLSGAVIVNKADFLSLSSSGPLTFLSSAGSLNFSVSTFGNGTARFLVQNGSQWYLSATSSTGNLGAAFNPSTELWYQFDPDTNQFFNTLSPGTAVAGSTLQDINAFGVYTQFSNFDGTGVLNGVRVNLNSFSANLTAVPEPSTTTTMAAALIGLFAHRMFKNRRDRLTVVTK